MKTIDYLINLDTGCQDFFEGYNIGNRKEFYFGYAKSSNGALLYEEHHEVKFNAERIIHSNTYTTHLMNLEFFYEILLYHLLNE